MPRLKFNMYVFITAIISIVAMLMAGLMLLLLPRSGEVVGIMQWRMMRASSFDIDLKARYIGNRDHRDENYIRKNDKESLSVDLSGRVVRAGGNELGGVLSDFNVVAGEVPYETDMEGSYRRIGDADFMRFDEMPDAVGAIDLTQYKGKWLRFVLDDIRERLDVPLFGSRGDGLSDEEGAELLLLFQKTPFLTFERKLRGTVIGDVKVNHYQVMPEVLFFKDYFVRSETIRLGRELTSTERLAVDRFFANVTAEDGELWIGRSDYYLYRIRLRFRYDDGERDGVLDISADLSKFNEGQTIPGPEGETLEVGEILSSLLPTISKHLPLAGDGAVRTAGSSAKKPVGLPIEVESMKEGDSDGDGLSNGLEAFYGSDPMNPDTDGDGVSDGDEIDQGLDPAGPGKLFDFGITDKQP